MLHEVGTRHGVDLIQRGRDIITDTTKPLIDAAGKTAKDAVDDVVDSTASILKRTKNVVPKGIDATIDKFERTLTGRLPRNVDPSARMMDAVGNVVDDVLDKVHNVTGKAGDDIVDKAAKAAKTSGSEVVQGVVDATKKSVDDFVKKPGLFSNLFRNADAFKDEAGVLAKAVSKVVSDQADKAVGSVVRAADDVLAAAPKMLQNVELDKLSKHLKGVGKGALGSLPMVASLNDLTRVVKDVGDLFEDGATNEEWMKALVHTGDAIGGLFLVPDLIAMSMDTEESMSTGTDQYGQGIFSTLVRETGILEDMGMTMEDLNTQSLAGDLVFGAEEDTEDEEQPIIARNREGESKAEAVARVQKKWPGRKVVFEDPDTPPIAWYKGEGL